MRKWNILSSRLCNRITCFGILVWGQRNMSLYVSPRSNLLTSTTCWGAQNPLLVAGENTSTFVDSPKLPISTVCWSQNGDGGQTPSVAPECGWISFWRQHRFLLVSGRGPHLFHKYQNQAKTDWWFPSNLILHPHQLCQLSNLIPSIGGDAGDWKSMVQWHFHSTHSPWDFFCRWSQTTNGWGNPSIEQFVFSNLLREPGVKSVDLIWVWF